MGWPNSQSRESKRVAPTLEDSMQPCIIQPANDLHGHHLILNLLCKMQTCGQLYLKITWVLEGSQMLLLHLRYFQPNNQWCIMIYHYKFNIVGYELLKYTDIYFFSPTQLQDNKKVNMYFQRQQRGGIEHMYDNYCLQRDPTFIPRHCVYKQNSLLLFS